MRKHQVADEENLAYLHGSPRTNGATDNLGASSMEFPLVDPSVDTRGIGEILVEAGKLTAADVEKIAELQRREGIFFGEAARRLKLLTEEDVQQALSKQFNYPYLKLSEGIFSNELVTAYQPFGPQAEIIRAIRSQLMLTWLTEATKTLAVTSPASGEGRTYVASNLAIAFAQAGKRTLLVDADMRKPRLHRIFDFPCRVGLSAMLAGRVKPEDLEHLPESVPFFSNLWVLGAGATPPNPLELLANNRLPRILRELGSYYDVILVDTPAANVADVQVIAACAGSALLVTRKNHTKVSESKKLLAALQNSRVGVVGSILNEY